MKSFIFDLNDKQAENSLSEKLEKIKGSGKDRVTLELENTTGKLPKNLELGIDVFLKIKQIQELPDWVIIKFLIAEGSLSTDDFKKRLFNA